MQPGDKIIWDSGFGWEIGYYVGENLNIHGYSRVQLITGAITNSTSCSTSEIHQWTKELTQQMEQKYRTFKYF